MKLIFFGIALPPDHIKAQDKEYLLKIVDK